MKKLARYLLIITMTFSIYSCDDIASKIASYMYSSPSDYQEEIEEFVKVEVAMTNSYVNNYMYFLFLDSCSDFDDVVIELGHHETSPNKYEKVLSRMANNRNYECNDVAKLILEEYRKTRIILSEYQKVPTSSQTQLWQFKEINTGLLFYFSINDEEYEIRIDNNSFEQYVERIIGIIGTPSKTMDTDNLLISKDTYDYIIDDALSASIEKQVVADYKSQKIYDRETQEFQSAFKAAIAAEAVSGYLCVDADPYYHAQDEIDINSLNITVNAKLLNKENAHVFVSLYPDTQPSLLVMVLDKETGLWLVDDIRDAQNTYSIKKELLECARSAYED